MICETSPTKLLIKIFENWHAKASEATKHYRNGFDWLPGRHIVRVRHNQREGENGKKEFRFVVITDYLDAVPIKERRFVKQVALTADYLAPTCAPIYRSINQDGSLGEMHLYSSMYLDEPYVEVFSALLARLAILQPVYAELQSAKVPEMFGWWRRSFCGRKRRAGIKLGHERG